MKKIYNFIKKTNSILIFIVGILLIGSFSRDVIKDLTQESYQPPKVELTSNETNVEVNINYKTKFYKKIKGKFLFKVNSDIIDQSVLRKVGTFSAGYYEEEHTINLVFVNEAGKISYLLEKDAYIMSVETPSFLEKSQHTVRNIYLIAAEDTNKDGFLSHEDSMTLYTSKVDGTDLKVAATEVVDYEFSDVNEIVVKWKEAEQSRHGTYNLDTNKLRTFDIEI